MGRCGVVARGTARLGVPAVEAGSMWRRLRRRQHHASRRATPALAKLQASAGPPPGKAWPEGNVAGTWPERGRKEFATGCEACAKNPSATGQPAVGLPMAGFERLAGSWPDAGRLRASGHPAATYRVAGRKITAEAPSYPRARSPSRCSGRALASRFSRCQAARRARA